MEIQIKMQKSEREKEADIRTKDYYEKFSKNWEIATSRLKPYLDKIAKKNRTENGNYRRTSHSFVYTGGIKENDRDTKVCSNRKKLS